MENSYLDNKYLLTMMIAKRAKQLNQGYKSLVTINTKNNRLLALREIQEGKVYIRREKVLSPDETDETDVFS